MQSWPNRFLSRASREVLLKNVIQAIPLHAMRLFLLPKELTREIERIMNSFWWRGDCRGKRGINWKEWKHLAKPRQWRGLNFRKLREFNLPMDIIRQHSRWRIGNATSVKIWGDKWLPSPDNPKIITPHFPLLQNESVSALFKVDNTGWHEEVIREIFYERDANLILSIPLALGTRRDKLIWNSDSKGTFIVKACYRNISAQLSPAQRLN
ncbi:PREDICTED: uncharacterized protein LOC109155235 [Ipomoea nil]|uniref:uncharacterized protein LOC109155235 n=1 Tax=Ipomoea nil TaxID=35883 RepID=UPI000901C7F2|nr:PREDICTED: uncharacterized protein LOC109155235 [Ipomoea nil]